MKKTKMSVRTAALLAAAALLFAGGTYTGVRAVPNIQSQYYETHFYLNHLQVHLLENGEDVCGGKNDLNGETKVTGRLATALGYESDDKLGAVEPGKLYQEEIAAQNGQDISQFVRMTIRKYWVQTDENGKVVTDENGDPVKITTLKPSQIHLRYDPGEDGYNTSAWTEVTADRTTESRTYVYNSLLPGGEATDEIFRYVMIDKNVADDYTETSTKEGSKTIYTYEYKYDGCAFFIEADVQAIQPHNAQEAIESQWGSGIRATYTETENGESGSLSVE